MSSMASLLTGRDGRKPTCKDDQWRLHRGCGGEPSPHSLLITTKLLFPVSPCRGGLAGSPSWLARLPTS